MIHLTCVGAPPSDLLLELASACSSCCTEADFACIVRGPARQMLPSTSLIAALGRIDLDHLEVELLLPVDHPPAATAAIRRTSNFRERRALASWIKSGKPMVLQLPESAPLLSGLELQEIVAFCLGRIAAHGVLDIAARSGSYFSFAGLPADLPNESVCTVLELITPHLHQALIRVRRNSKQAAPDQLTLSPIEWEILRWAAAGRTTAEIAQIRGRSPSTVRNQLVTIFEKLEVSSRVEAVRKVHHLL